MNFSHLLAHITRNKCTYMDIVPSVWMAIFRLGIELHSSLRVLMFGGEKMTPQMFEIMCTNAPATAHLVNAYGPAECTIAATFKLLIRYAQTISIGSPITNVHCYIAAPDGVVGELWIGGKGVMDKYLNVANPCIDGWYPTGDLCYRLNGEYFIVGRKDFQVKLRGQRIECGEIENVLGHQAVVVKDPALERLVAFVVCDPALEHDLRLKCQGKLPEYMVPSLIICLESMPLTANGKSDRKQLLSLIPSRRRLFCSSYTSLMVSSETLVLEAIEEIFKIKVKDLSLDFFKDIGGDSLSAALFCSKLGNIISVQLRMYIHVKHSLL